MPFDQETLVFKVAGKMFALTNTLRLPLSVNLKCQPELALELRERYHAVTPGYHQNKRHWNTVVMDGTIPARELREMIDHSYNLVVAGLPKKIREEFFPQ
jgi:predicted DNA-binding protein (MmcQ/YjbR family)